MKHNGDQDVVTKGFLRDILQNYPTKADLKEELDVVRTEARQYQDEILTKFNSVINELEDSRENRTLEMYKTKELRDTAEDHERRITKLEHSQKAA